MKVNKLLLSMICVLTFAGTQLWGQKLSHEMTEEEKALMPAYLKSQQPLLRTSRMPAHAPRSIAEFEPNEGVIIAYPLGIPVDLVAEMSEDVKIVTILDNASKEKQARKKYKSAGVNMGNCQFLHVPHDSYWTRDYSPMFITEGDEKVSIVDFIYDRPRPNDNNIPSKMGSFLNLDVHKVNLVMTGGNYMSDGMGTAAATDLIWEENSISKKEVNSRLNNYLGIKTHHVTEDPLGDYIKHIDCWGKFLDVDKVLITEVPKSNKQYAAYERVANYFKNAKSAYGNKYQVYRVYASNGEPYTNSLILNDKVLVPIKGTTNDNKALNTYRKAMPG
ncbi:MAG: agmatine deiminase family protein, partial [Bacteroidales bacterium]|nr:agmatine deiminase family protein [Bacteroidales bacterium]